MANIGYVRVSTLIQNTDRQLADVLDDMDAVFTDKTSGKDADRPALKECLATLKAGDTLHVHAIDRLARSLDDLRKIAKGLTERGINMMVHTQGLYFNSSKNDPAAKLLMNLLGAVAEFERETMLERQREGIAIAKAAGKYKGRKATAQAKSGEVMDLLAKGLTKQQTADALNIGVASVYRIVKAQGDDRG